MARSASGALRDRRTGRWPLSLIAGNRAKTLGARFYASEKPPPHRPRAELDPSLTDNGRMPFESIRSITYRNRLAGAGEGLLVGGLSGGLTGFLLTAVVSSSICDSLPHPADGTSSCHTNSSIVPVVASTVVGGLVGALIGSHVGHRTTLTF